MKSSHSNGIYAEYAVIGSLLINNNMWHEIGDYLHADDFVDYFHREVYCAIQDLLTNNKNADLICVSQYLVDNKITHEDSFVRLCEIANNTFSTANIKHYADIVKQKSLDRKMIKTAQNIINSVHEQREDRLDQAQKKIHELTNEISTSPSLASEILKSVVTAIDERNITNEEITGISTGYTALDKLTHGLQKGDLIILAGRPSMGKTLLGMNIAEHVSLQNKLPVAVFSLEMSKEKLLERSLSSVGSIEANQIKTGILTDNSLQKLSSIIPKYQQAKMFIDDRSSLRVSDIRSACRRIQQDHGLSLIVIDYIGLMSSEGENETLRITNISRGLKLLARDLNVPVIAISQLNRSVEQRNNKRPCMADLRQSGAIEQDADLILFVYRQHVYDPNLMNTDLAELIIAKHRNGEVGTVNLSFNSRNCRFDNYLGNPHVSEKIERTWSGRPLIY